MRQQLKLIWKWLGNGRNYEGKKKERKEIRKGRKIKERNRKGEKETITKEKKVREKENEKERNGKGSEKRRENKVNNRPVSAFAKQLHCSNSWYVYLLNMSDCPTDE